MWQPRCLTLKGRITAVKYLIIQHILPTASIVPCGVSLFNETENLLFVFIWNNKKHLIVEHNLIQPIDAGGLKMISIYDVVKTAKIVWIKRICNLESIGITLNGCHKNRFIQEAFS